MSAKTIRLALLSALTLSPLAAAAAVPFRPEHGPARGSVPATPEASRHTYPGRPRAGESGRLDLAPYAGSGHGRDSVPEPYPSPWNGTICPPYC